MDDARGHLERSFGILERASRRILGVRRIALDLSSREPVTFVIPRRSRGTCFSFVIPNAARELDVRFVIPSAVRELFLGLIKQVPRPNHVGLGMTGELPASE